MVFSRTDFVTAKALYLAYNLLDKEETLEKRKPNDIADILEILQTKYPSMLELFKDREEGGLQI